MNVALKPGDHAIVHAPYYQSLGEVARGAVPKSPNGGETRNGDGNLTWQN